MPKTKEDEPVNKKYKVIALYPGCQLKVGDEIEKHQFASGKWYVPGMLSDPDDYPHLFEVGGFDRRN